jgi:hypothetical protein
MKSLKEGTPFGEQKRCKKILGEKQWKFIKLHPLFMESAL